MDDAPECPQCNGGHTLADCPDLTLEELEEIYAQFGEEHGAQDDEEEVGFLQLCEEVVEPPSINSIVFSSKRMPLRSLSVCDDFLHFFPPSSTETETEHVMSDAMFFSKWSHLAD